MLPSTGFLPFLAVFLAFAPTPAHADNIESYFERSVKPKTQVLLFAEAHFENSHLASLIHNLRALHTKFPRFDCLFLEVEDALFQPSIDGYLNDGAPFEPVLEAEKLSLKRMSKPTDSKFSISMAAKPVLDAAKLFHLKVFAIDLVHTKEMLAESSKVVATHVQTAANYHYEYFLRNQHMAKRIEDALRSGSCHGGIFQGGSLHIDTSYWIPAYRETALPIKTLLERDGIPTQAYVTRENEQTFKAETAKIPGAVQRYRTMYDGFLFYSGQAPRVYAHFTDF